MTAYEFKVKSNNGEEIELSKYKGKTLLIVNTATKCGLTPQYEALEALYKKYQDKGFEILDFPSNQFLKQAPGSDDEINDFCTLNYNTTFDRFSKIDVNGDDTIPLYKWLKSERPQASGDKESESFDKKVKLLKPFAKKDDIKWNFEKFLVDKEGNVVDRFSPGYVPEKLEKRIEELL